MAMSWIGEDMVCEHRESKATAAAIDCTGRFLVLAGRLGTSVIDLNTPQTVSRKLSRKSKWEVSVVAWNHHPEFRHLIAVASNQKVDLLRFDYQTGELIDLQQSIKGHARAVLDLDWNVAEPGLLVTCSVDSYVNVWDSKDLRKPIASLPSVCGASQAKWAKASKARNYLATAHEADCKIWDFRKASTPVEYIAAHSAKINGIDWSVSNADHLVTCAQDCTVKVWDITSPKKPEQTVSVSAPVWRARFTPFGEGLVTVGIPQLHRGDTSLVLWALHDTSWTHLYSGHTEGVYDFFWRSPRISDYQLISWSKDQTLRLWKTDSAIQKQCGSAYLNHTIVLDYHQEGQQIFQEKENTLSTSSLFSDGLSPPFAPYSPLDKELHSIDMPNVSIDDIDLKLRTCTLIVNAGPHLVKMLMSFPLGYPEVHCPSFQMAPETTLNPAAIRQITQAVNDTFARCLRNQAISVALAARTVAQFLGTLSSDASPSPRLDPHPVFISPPGRQQPQPAFKVGSRFMIQRVDSPLISTGIAKLLGNQMSFTSDTPIPFPRICGACFAGDKLVMWSDAWKLGFSTTKPMFDIRGVTSVYPAELSVRQRQITKALRKKGKPEKCSITIFNVEGLLSVHPVLAARYLNDSHNPFQSLMFNAQLAESVDRRDLGQVWRLLAVVSKANTSLNYDMDEAPWSLHPFGRKMLDNIIDHYRDLFDCAFLATLACIFCQFPCSQKCLSVPNRASKSASVLNVSSSPHHTIHSDETCDGWSQIVSTTKSKGKRSSSWNTTTDRQEMLEDCRDNFDSHVLNPSRKEEIDLFKKEYCDILYGFRLLNKRAEILKCLGNAPDPHRGIEFSSICHNCRCEVPRGSRCFSCKNIATTCGVCHAPVRGLSTFCIGCGHGGHMFHVEEWFTRNSVCPTGCGCSCLEIMKVL